MVKISEIFDTTKGEMVYSKRTICEIHRDIYDELIISLYKKDIELFKKIIPLLEEAFIMGTRMNHRLIKCGCGNDDWCDYNENIEDIKRKREKRIEIIRIAGNNNKKVDGKQND